MTPTQREKFIELLKEEILSLNEEKMNEYTFVLDNLDKFQWFFDKMFTKHNEPINRSYRLATGVLSDAPHFEKVLRGVTRSRYLKVLRGTLPHKAYRRENILFGILASTKDGNRINKIVNPNPSFTDKSLRNHVHRMYHKKYTPIITNEMDRIKKKAYKFKMSEAAQSFIRHHERLQFDIDLMFKYLAFTGKISSTKEDMIWLHYFVKFTLEAKYPDLWKDKDLIQDEINFLAENMSEFDEFEEVLNSHDIQIGLDEIQ